MPSTGFGRSLMKGILKNNSILIFVALFRCDRGGSTIATVGAALAHPILRRAAACAGKGGLRRETPVLLRRDDGSLVEGTVITATLSSNSKSIKTFVFYRTGIDYFTITILPRSILGLTNHRYHEMLFPVLSNLTFQL
jgi:hypothetical protein